MVNFDWGAEFALLSSVYGFTPSYMSSEFSLPQFFCYLEQAYIFKAQEATMRMEGMVGSIGSIGLSQLRTTNKINKINKSNIKTLEREDHKTKINKKKSEYKDDFGALINDRNTIDSSVYRLKKKYPNKKQFDFGDIIAEIGRHHNKEAEKSGNITYKVKI